MESLKKIHKFFSICKSFLYQNVGIIQKRTGHVQKNDKFVLEMHALEQPAHLEKEQLFLSSSFSFESNITAVQMGFSSPYLFW